MSRGPGKKRERDHVAFVEAAQDSLGRHVRAGRAKLGLTQQDLAGLSGLSRAQLDLVESGCTNPTLRTIVSLSRALNVPVSELIGEVRK
jgi:transcriptional regulator with XRE-family HTH domain